MIKRKSLKGELQNVFVALLILSIYSTALSLIRIATSQSSTLWFLIWNLLLAWIPLIFAWLLFANTQSNSMRWSKRNMLYFIVWFLFLPNAFYILTDFVHLDGLFDEPERLYDIVLLASYTVLGMVLGFLALLLVHIRMVQRFGQRGHWLPIIVLLLSGFAIYLGRYLRWNSWDVLINPFALLFDISDRLVNPTNHGLTFFTTLLFFSFYGILYVLVWRLYIFACVKRTDS